MARSTSVIDYRGRFAFAVPPEALWTSIEHGERFEAWWAWLREFRLEGPGLEAGAVLHGVVSPPVPYTMRIRVELDRCVRPERIDATVHGDLEGPACLVLDPAGPGTVAEVAWTVEMTQRAMRLAARFAHPLMRWGHDRVIEATVNGYRRQLAATAPPDTVPPDTAPPDTVAPDTVAPDTARPDTARPDRGTGGPR